MSNKKTSTKEKTTRDKKSQGPSRLHALFHGEQARFIWGLVILLLSAVVGVGILSSLVTGRDDQSIIENLSWYQILSPGNHVQNWMGTFGAFAGEYLVNRWLGIPVILFVVLALRFGYEMAQRNLTSNFFKSFVRTACCVIWLSLCLSTVSYVVEEWFGLQLQSGYLLLGGRHGYELTQLLAANLHIPGLILLVIVLGLILSTFLFATTIEKTRSLFGLIPFLQGRYDVYKAREERRRQLREEAEEQERLEKERQEQEEEERRRQEELDRQNAVDSENPAGSDVDDVTPASGPASTAGSQTPTDETPGTTTPPATQLGTFVPGSEGGKIEGVTSNEKPNDGFTVTVAKNEDAVEKPAVEDTEDLPTTDYDPTAELSMYKFPGFDLLKTYSNNSPVDMEEQTANKEKIKQTLSDYGIEIQSISATVGPTITLFEIVLESGTKISRVKNLSDEIAMSIASKSGIRIIAPIPGKCAIGIEVPNNDPQTVSMRDCIASRAFQESKMELPVALGKTITNEVFTFDLAKAPHLLVAGATGQGKSVGLNAIVTSLLYKKHPSQLKIVLVDPKMVEFSIYKSIEKHYLAKLPDQENPIITDVTKTVDILKSLCAEMEDRYALVEDAGVRNIKEYNDKFIHRKLNPKKHITAPIGSREGTNHRYLPYIVAIIDEYGDLIMTAGKEVELPIARIAQKARAVGIHMIIATQRPSAKIVTGIIKANFPARIAFRVSQSIDSSIILDQPGAQNLIGRGDLLYSAGNVPTRVQCAFVDTPEVDRINRFISAQQSFPTALILPEPKLQEGDGGGDGDGAGEPVDLHQLDPLFSECAQLVVATGQGSTSMIQRKFMIGYNRAGRIMDQLEAAGIVGPYSGSKARAVLVSSDSELFQVLEDLKTR